MFDRFDAQSGNILRLEDSASIDLVSNGLLSRATEGLSFQSYNLELKVLQVAPEARLKQKMGTERLCAASAVGHIQ